jgi:hypothetical protein
MPDYSEDWQISTSSLKIAFCRKHRLFNIQPLSTVEVANQNIERKVSKFRDGECFFSATP